MQQYYVADRHFVINALSQISVIRFLYILKTVHTGSVKPVIVQVSRRCSSVITIISSPTSSAEVVAGHLASFLEEKVYGKSTKGSIIT